MSAAIQPDMPRSWVGPGLLVTAVLILADVSVSLVTRTAAGALPDSPEWRRNVWSGMAGQLTAVVAVAVLTLAAFSLDAGHRVWARLIARATSVPLAGLLLVAAIGVILDGGQVIASRPPESASLLWVSVWLDAARGAAGAAFCLLVAWRLRLRGPQAAAGA